MPNKGIQREGTLTLQVPAHAGCQYATAALDLRPACREGPLEAPRPSRYFPGRFPRQEDTGNLGWHVDASFPGAAADPNDFLSWRINVQSHGRALLMLFLFSDVQFHGKATRGAEEHASLSDR